MHEHLSGERRLNAVFRVKRVTVSDVFSGSSVVSDRPEGAVTELTPELCGCKKHYHTVICCPKGFSPIKKKRKVNLPTETLTSPQLHV